MARESSEEGVGQREHALNAQSELSWFRSKDGEVLLADDIPFHEMSDQPFLCDFASRGEGEFSSSHFSASDELHSTVFRGDADEGWMFVVVVVAAVVVVSLCFDSHGCCWWRWRWMG